MNRVRFAPSPTGNLHIGGARTALFNWIFARNTGGKFILRIEDTDAKRSKQEFLDEILYSLEWLGFAWDEIYYQSKRFDVYRKLAEKLVKDGKAYYDTGEAIAEADEADAEPEPRQKVQDAVIFKVQPQKIKVTDVIRGEIEFDSALIKDQVLIKSDGTPTYNFACVVDDSEMQMTHIIRGDDHISNTPKQIMLYQALGFPVPAFAHLPLILGKDGGRLSKRTGATAISEYHNMGYLPQALVNYLLLLGWAPGGNRELIDIKEAVKLFRLKHVNKTAAVFDIDKLKWINNQYIRKADPAALAEEIIPLLTERGLIAAEDVDKAYIASLVKLFQSRLPVLNDFPDWADFFFTEDFKMDPAAQEQYLSTDLSKEFKLYTGRLTALDKWEVAEVERIFRELVKELNIEAKALVHPIRVALTGKTVGVGLFEAIYYLGKERVIKRLSRWIKS
ncbi:MAG: glutamate--tRNA ligase [Candidatus Omnitrophica bacterium]|nr:glutamate--tRNA ligase [Candidatus Omnitrophota bacterium]MDD5655221.1 glutamate--tRNA ligase [Candidatus Omnitrophota bacterium]